MTNSRAKGARIERAAAKYLTSLGFPAERNARNGISTDDLVVPSLPRVHIEVKGDRSIGLGTKALADAIEQAERDRGGRCAAVLWYEHRKGWRLSVLDCIGNTVTYAGSSEIASALAWLNGDKAIMASGESQ